MLLSRFGFGKRKDDPETVAAATRAAAVERAQKLKMPALDEFLAKNDFQGAISFLLYKTQHEEPKESTFLWLAYCHIRIGEFQKSVDNGYIPLLSMSPSEPTRKEVYLHLSIVFFYAGDYEKAQMYAEKDSSKNALQNRLLFHIAQRMGNEKKLMAHHQKLSDSLEDRLSLAAMHYCRQHYQQAIDVYKKVLTEKQEYLALNVFLAMCYYRLDYYDSSTELLQVYLRQFPDSPGALNLKACNTDFQTQNNKAAAAELDALHKEAQNLPLAISDIIRHNMVVFRRGHDALQVLPPILDSVEEARLNLTLYHLRHGDVQSARSLVQNMVMVSPMHVYVKAVTELAMGQARGDKHQMSEAADYYRVCGDSPAECDTILGRQAMASANFVEGKYHEVLIYLSSIKEFSTNDDIFHMNYGQALVKCEKWAEAADELAAVKDEKLRQSATFLQAFGKAMMYARRGAEAWRRYMQLAELVAANSAGARSAPEKLRQAAQQLLLVVAHDGCRQKDFYHSALAFAELERLDPGPDHWEGKRAAAVGLFVQLTTGETSASAMSDVLRLLERGSPASPGLASDKIVEVVRGWARRAGVTLQ